MKLDEEGFPEGLFLSKLSSIVEIIKQAREEALERQDQEWADDQQVLGMRAYKRSVYLLQEASLSGRIENLKVCEPQGRLTLIIDDVPLRFWRNGDYDDTPEERRLVFSQVALQMSLFDPVDLVDRWAIIYHTSADGLLLEAALIGYCSVTSSVVRRKDIPVVDSYSPTLASVLDQLPKEESVDRTKVRVRPKVVDTKYIKDE
jgi:hypothetical protein